MHVAKRLPLKKVYLSRCVVDGTRTSLVTPANMIAEACVFHKRVRMTHPNSQLRVAGIITAVIHPAKVVWNPSPDPDDTLGVAGGWCKLVPSLVGFFALGKLLRHDIPRYNGNTGQRDKTDKTSRKMWLSTKHMINKVLRISFLF